MASDSVTATELTDLRSDAATWLDLTCDIQRATTAADAWGGQSASWATLSSGVACGLARPSQAIMQQYASKVGSMQVWLVSLPYGTTIAEGDRLTVDSQTLLVQADLSQSSYSTLAQVLASEVR